MFSDINLIKCFISGPIRFAEIGWKNKPKLNCCERETLFRPKKEAKHCFISIMDTKIEKTGVDLVGP